MSKFKNWLVSAFVALAVAGCGGGGGDAGKSVFEEETTSGSTDGSTTTTSTQALSLTVQLLDGGNQATTNLVAGSTLRVKALLKKNNVVVKDQLVQFSLEQSGDYAVLDQLSNLTDDAGVALVNLTPGTISGAGRVKVLATLDDGSKIESAANYVATATAQQTSSLTLANFRTDASQVSAYGTTGFSVEVRNNGVAYGTPVTVSFSSDCASGKALVTTSATTTPSGVAVGTFEDKGCASSSVRPVVLTASISTNTAQTQLQVLPSTVGSLRFVSVSPSDASITLKGQGGNGRQENAQLVFKLVDQAGNGVANTDVCFDSTTYVGGLTLDGFNNLTGNLPTNQGGAALCGSDAIAQIRYVKRTDASGNVSVQIASGTVPTPVRVRARAIYPSTASTALETFSDSLSISTGLPLQRSFSLSVDKANIDGGNGTGGRAFDGDEATLTVRLADQFSNPVPDGTKVTFVSSGAAVCTSQNGSCTTVNGSCSCKLIGQNRRPLDGRVVVLAYADGLEDYIDTNGDNLFTTGEAFSDLADAFVDSNKSGGYSGAAVNGDTDIPIPYQTPTPDYVSGNGARGNAHIRASTIIYMSAPTGSGSSAMVIPSSDLNRSLDLLLATSASNPTSLANRYIRIDPLGGCPAGGSLPLRSFSFRLDDGFGNPLAAGTTLTPSDFSDNLGSRSVRPNAVLALGARAPSTSIDGPSNGAGGNVVKAIPWSTTADLGNVTSSHVLTVQGVSDKCFGSASFALDAKSPKGAAELVNILYEGEPRSVSRYQFKVHYLDPLNLSIDDSVVQVNDTVSITTAIWSFPSTTGFKSYSLDWGDGSAPVSSTSPLLSVPSHQYTTAGTRVIRLTVTDTDDNTYSDSVTVTVNTP